MATVKVVARPQRTCAGCRSVRDKRDLLRIVGSGSGAVGPDPSGRSHGRGAYLCPRQECAQLARRKGSLDRSLKVSISALDWDAILACIRDMSFIGIGGTDEG